LANGANNKGTMVQERFGAMKTNQTAGPCDKNAFVTQLVANYAPFKSRFLTDRLHDNPLWQLPTKYMYVRR
jgi:hypothetical protein